MEISFTYPEIVFIILLILVFGCNCIPDKKEPAKPVRRNRRIHSGPY